MTPTIPPVADDEAMRIASIIERVEAATGPDREIDFEVATIILPEVIDDMRVFRDMGEHGRDVVRRHAQYPAYTASLDAAMTLVPEGAHWGLGHDATGPMKGWAWVRVKTADGWQELHSPPKMGFRHVAPWPQSPALALCAAALRSRASLQNGGTGDGQ